MIISSWCELLKNNKSDIYTRPKNTLKSIQIIQI